MQIKELLSGNEPTCFKAMAGTLTLTLIEAQCQTLFPWVLLQSATYDKIRISLTFPENAVEIAGQNLDELWEGIQQQSILWIKLAENQIPSLCHVEEINLIQKKSPPTKGGES